MDPWTKESGENTKSDFDILLETLSLCVPNTHFIYQKGDELAAIVLPFTDLTRAKFDNYLIKLCQFPQKCLVTHENKIYLITPNIDLEYIDESAVWTIISTLCLFVSSVSIHVGDGAQELFVPKNCSFKDVNTKCLPYFLEMLMNFHGIGKSSPEDGVTYFVNDDLYYVREKYHTLRKLVVQDRITHWKDGVLCNHCCK